MGVAVSGFHIHSEEREKVSWVEFARVRCLGGEWKASGSDFAIVLRENMFLWGFDGSALESRSGEVAGLSTVVYRIMRVRSGS
eukprot:3595894-Pyramimonas_sp.AAC.1